MSSLNINISARETKQKKNGIGNPRHTNKKLDGDKFLCEINKERNAKTIVH